ncbi:MAG: hypothetical protein GYB65_02830 [Chloroflexi bacterium]|nr:hypothetical protein [Chloroflexota bacterium]
MFRRCLFCLLLIALLVSPFSVQAQDPPLLDAQYESADGRLRFAYPGAWVVDDHSFARLNMIVVGSSEAALNALAAERSLPDGESVVGIMLPQPGVAPEDVFSGWWSVGQLTGGAPLFPEPPTRSEPQPTVINDYPARRMDFPPDELDSAWFSIDYGWAKLFVVTYGAFDNHGDTLAALLDTLGFQPIPDVLTFITPLADLWLDYPGDWLAYETTDTNDVVLTSPEGLELRVPGLYRQFPYPSDDAAGLATETLSVMAHNSYGDTAYMIAQVADIAAPVDVQHGDNTGVRIDYTESNSEGFALALEFDGYLLPVMVQAEPGTLADQEADLALVLEALRYAAPEDVSLEVWEGWQMWQRHAIRHYTLMVEHRDANFRAETHTLTVANGRVIAYAVDCTLPSDSACDPADFDPDAYTVPGLYATAMRLARERSSGDWRFTLRTDSNDGHPLRISVFNTELADSGESWEVVTFDTLGD